MSDLINNDKKFRYLPLNSKYCTNDEYTQNLLSDINKISNCSDKCFNENIKIDIINNTCIESCIINGYHYKLNNICYSECPEDSYLKYCDREDCINMEVKECFDRTPEGYYLDLNSKTYKKCYDNCKFCYGERNGINNNCKKCINNLKFINEILYKNNCFQRCDNYYFFNENNEYQCIESCQGKYNKVINEKNKCIDECINDDTYKHEYNNTCYTLDKKLQIIKNENSDIMIRETIFSYIQELLLLNNTKDDDIELDIQDKVQVKIKDLMKYELNITTVNGDNDITINIGSVNYTITTTNNQKNNDNNNVSTIILGECENELKEEYNISKNDSLYIFKVDLIIEKIHKVEYEVYYPFLPNNLTLLNLSECKDIKIDIFIPFHIPKGQIDKYNKSSELYNSICVISTSEDGTDEPYKDRQNNYIKNNSLKVCEENCDFNDYDTINQRALCSCFTKIKLPAISEIKIDEEKMYYNFKNIKNIANFKMLECIYLFFNKNNLINNSSNYMMISLTSLSLVSLFSFICSNCLKIKNTINQLSQNLSSRRKHRLTTNINNMHNKNKSSKRNILNKRNSISIINNNNKIPILIQLINARKSFSRASVDYVNDKNKLLANNANITSNYLNQTKIKSPKNQKKINNNKKIIITNNTKILLKNISNNDTNNIQLITKEKIILKNLNDNEINFLDYEQARSKDKRTYCQYYFSLLRTKHILIFTFFHFDDYNSQSIKIYIFFFTFSINYVVSAMFYSDDTMHKINVDKGSFELTYQLPIMVYSFLISAILKTLINNLGLYEEDILSFKKSRNKNLIERQKVINRIICKILFFFIITYILLLFFWIFLGCFCAVYKNTQIHLLIDVSSSFGLSFITPFFINLFPGIFRMLSLKGKIKKPYLFKFSKLLQLI